MSWLALVSERGLCGERPASNTSIAIGKRLPDLIYGAVQGFTWREHGQPVKFNDVVVLYRCGGSGGTNGERQTLPL